MGNLKNKFFLVLFVVFIFVIIAFMSIFLFSLISADADIGEPNYSIEKTYGPQFGISGWINLSFEDEPTNSLFTVFFDGVSGNSVSLQKILDLNPDYTYSCVPSDCGKNYFTSLPAASKTFAMSSSESRIFGLLLTGKVIAINSINFEIESTAGPSCESQLKVDILDDEVIDMLNSNVGSIACSGLKSYGCFEASAATEEYILSPGRTYCQKINLSESPGFRLGAWIKQISGSSTINVTLYNINGAKKGSCSLSSVTSTSGQEYSCDIDYLVTKSENHYVCVSILGGDGNYRIRGNSNPSSFCGFPSVPILQETAAYSIFAQGKQFNSVGTLNVNNSLPSGFTMSGVAYDYIIQRYGISAGEIDCTDGCVIPIKFASSASQTVTLKNLRVNYQKLAGSVEEQNFYTLEESAPKITSNFRRMFFTNSGLKVPGNFGDYDFVLKLNNQELIEEEISVKDVPMIQFLIPTSAASAYPTDFSITLFLPDDVNITAYVWEFGDNTTETTYENKVQHIYENVGKYNLTVTVKDTRGFSSSKTFEITVDSPKNLINTTLIDSEKKLEIIKNYTQGKPFFQEKSINDILKIENISSTLEKLKQEYEVALLQEDETRQNLEMNSIIRELLNINLPGHLFGTKQAVDMILFSEKEFVDMDAVKAVAEGEYPASRIEDYQSAVIFWQQENLDLTVDFNEFSAEYDSEIKPLVRVFEIEIFEKTDIIYDYYLIIPKLANIGFDRNMQEYGNFYYTNLDGISKISFYTTENIDFSEIPIFISPGISRLSVVEFPSFDEGESKVTSLILFLVLLMFLATVVYIVLQQWYKRKYENYLFPNRNDLYNVVHYVNSSKKKGLENSQIRRSLKKAGWNVEQIRYVTRKYEGKRTGMLELPITKLFDKKKLPKPKPPHTRPAHSSHLRR